MKKIYIPKRELRYLIENKKMSVSDVAKRYGCDKCTISRRLNEYKIVPPTHANRISNGTKGCAACGERKPISEFFRNKCTFDGLTWQCKTCVTQNRNRWREKHPRRYWANSVLISHRRSGFDVRITIDWLTNHVKNINWCPLCGERLVWGRKPAGLPIHQSPSLDRVHNENFISENNILIMCYRCNTAKGDGSIDDYILHCKKVVEGSFEEDCKCMHIR